MSIPQDRLNEMIRRAQEVDAAERAETAPRQTIDPDARAAILARAQEADQLEREGPTAGQITEGLGRAGARGVEGGFEFYGDMFDRTMPVTVLNKALETYNYLKTRAAGREYVRPDEPEATQRLRDKVWQYTKPYTERKLPPGQHPVLEGALTASEFLGGAATGGPVGGIKQAALMALRSSLGAGVISTIAESLGYGDDPDKVWAEIAGAVAATINPRTAAQGLSKLVNLLKPIKDPVIRKQAVDDLYESIVGDEGPEAAQKIIDDLRARLANEDIGTLGVQAGTPGALAAEAAITKRAGIQTPVRAVDEQAQAQVVERLRAEVPPGDPERAVALQQSLAAEQRTMAQAREGIASDVAATREAEKVAGEAKVLTQAEEAATRARAAQPEVLDVPEAGQRTAAKLAENRAAAKADEVEAWSKVPKEELIPTAELKAALLAALPKTEQGRTAFARAHPNIMADIKKAMKDPDIEGAELIDLQHNINDSISSASKAGLGSTFDEAVSTRMSVAIRESIDAVEDVGQAFIDARAATAHRAQTFDTGPLGEARKAALKSESAVGEKLTPSGSPGVEVTAAAEAGGLLPELVASTRAQFERAAFKDGVFQEVAARKFLRDKKALLDRAPGLRADLQGITDMSATAATRGKAFPKAQEAAAKTRAAEERAATTTKKTELAEIEATPAAKFQGESGVARAEDVLQSKTPAADIRALREAAEAQGPQAVDDLRSAFFNAVYNLDVTKLPGGKEIRSGEIGVRMANRRRALKEILTEDQMNRLDELVEPLERLKRKRGVTVAAIKDITDVPVGRIKGLIGKVLGAQLGTLLTSNPLIGATLGTGVARRYLKELPQQKYEKFLSDYILDPSKFLDEFDALNKVKTGEETVSVLRRIFERAPLVTGAAALAQPEE